MQLVDNNSLKSSEFRKKYKVQRAKIKLDKGPVQLYGYF